MNPSDCRRALAAAFLAVPLASAVVQAAEDSDGVGRIAAAFDAMKTDNDAQRNAAKDDPMAVFAAQLAAKYKVTLAPAPNKNHCSCSQYRVTDNRDGHYIGDIEAEGGSEEKMKADLENRLRQRLTEPLKPAASAAKSSGLKSAVSDDAWALMQAQGIYFDADNNLHTPNRQVKLNGDVRSVTIDIDPNNQKALIVTVKNKDGLEDTRRFIGGREVR